MLKELLTQAVAIPALFKGFVVLNLLTLPLTALLIFYMTVMGASNPSKPGFVNTLGIVVFFVYGTQLGVLLWLIGFGKVFDVVLQFSAIRIATVSWVGLVLAAMTFVAAGNIFVDHLYQFKQGNYSISLVALLITLAYVAVVYFAAQYFPLAQSH